jgi:hypothetical protein
MPTINQLSSVDTVSSGDLIAVYVPNNGDARKMSINTLLNYFQNTFASPDVFTQLATPGTGFNLAVTNNGNNGWVLLQPAGTLATGTVTLPLSSVAADGQEITITTTQQITSFTLAGNGATALYGDPTTLNAEAFFKMRFYRPTNSWYRVA